MPKKRKRQAATLQKDTFKAKKRKSSHQGCESPYFKVKDNAHVSDQGFTTISDKNKDDDKAPPKSSKYFSAHNDDKHPFSFYDVSCITLAKALLGKNIVRKLDDGTLLVGKIVETEAYVGSEDKAAHSYKGKRTQRNEAMYMPPGTIYVYNIYGTYCCMNISSRGK